MGFFGGDLALVPRKLLSSRRFAVQTVLHTGGTLYCSVCVRCALRGARAAGCPKGTVATSRAQALQRGTGPRCHMLLSSRSLPREPAAETRMKSTDIWVSFHLQRGKKFSGRGVHGCCEHGLRKNTVGLLPWDAERL